MRREMHRRIRLEQDRIVHQQRELNLLSPYAVLKRGYVIVENTEGRPVAATAELEAGQEVRMLFADGEAGASILSVTRRGE
jgi:exodeoxyribonuclease VII large subunit